MVMFIQICTAYSVLKFSGMEENTTKNSSSNKNGNLHIRNVLYPKAVFIKHL